jgi:Protein of unknown function (DUF3617)
MRIQLRISVVLVSAIFATAAVADEIPPRKPGGWEIVVSGEKIDDVKMKLCIDKETDQLFNKNGTELSDKKCSRRDVKVNGDVTTIDSLCKLGGTTETSSTVMTFTGDTAFHSETKIHFEPALAGKTDVVTTQDGKWTGPCAGGMKPGDMIAGNGPKLNIKMLDTVRKFLQ